MNHIIRSLLRLPGQLLQGETRAKGLDISHWAGTFDPTRSQVPLDFVVQKVTEGTTWIDPLVDALWQGVKQVPMRLAYHYQRSGMSWALQVDHFLMVANRYDFHGYALDVESINNTYNDTFFSDTRRIIDEVKKRTGKKVLLYTNIYTYGVMVAALRRQYTDADAWLAAQDLWIAYPSKTLLEPPLPQGRTTWTIWQWSWTETNLGTQSAADADLFNGTADQMRSWLGIVTDPPPPQEEPVAEYEVVTLKSDMSLRYDHNTSGGKKGTVPLAGTKLIADQIWIAPQDLFNASGVKINQAGDEWAYIPSEGAWIAITHLGVIYCSYAPINQPDPVQVVFTVADLKFYDDGTVTGTWTEP